MASLGSASSASSSVAVAIRLIYGGPHNEWGKRKRTAAAAHTPGAVAMGPCAGSG